MEGTILFTNLFVYGKDISGTLESGSSGNCAGRVRGLLATRMDGKWHFPLYDNNGNITEYLDTTGGSGAILVLAELGKCKRFYLCFTKQTSRIVGRANPKITYKIKKRFYEKFI